MILLLGGTSETAPLAWALAEAGHRVLVSTATTAPLDLGAHPAIRRRCGRLTARGLTALLRREQIDVVVDATHPYATLVRRNARSAAAAVGARYLTFVRPSSLRGDEPVQHAHSHTEAAQLAVALGTTVLLTTGTKHLEPYVSATRRSGRRLIVRVLDDAASVDACRCAGIPNCDVVTGRGPFTVQQNRELIRRFAVGVLVTKDSGEAGGVSAKLQAASEAGCGVVVVDRPELGGPTPCESISELLGQV